MNSANIVSVIRHWVVAILSAASLWIIGALSLDAGQQQALAKATSDLAGPLAAVLALLVIALWRFVVLWVQSLFSDKSSGAADTGGTKALGACVLPWAGLAVFLGFSPPACTPQQMEAAKQVPVKGCYIDEHGNSVCYSTQDGVIVTVDRRSSK